MSQLRKEVSPFLNRDEVAEIVTQLARQIEADYEGKEVVFICPLRGSIHFLADLVRKLDLHCVIDFVYLTGGSNGGVVKIIKDISANISDKHVVVVEEIIDTGKTLSFLCHRLKASSPDKPARREIPLKADYIGKTIEDRYVVGYGMDSEELGRNYPDIYILRN
jgi:hypoxanthine phosphoribosyltransferase